MGDPAFFESWFPFPDNSRLDWNNLGHADYLYVSPLHRDHFDTELLSRHVHKNCPRHPEFGPQNRVGSSRGGEERL